MDVVLRIVQAADQSGDGFRCVRACECGYVEAAGLGATTRIAGDALRERASWTTALRHCWLKFC
jgi:hypothetical protein